MGNCHLLWLVNIRHDVEWGAGGWLWRIERVVVSGNFRFATGAASVFGGPLPPPASAIEPLPPAAVSVSGLRCHPAANGDYVLAVSLYAAFYAAQLDAGSLLICRAALTCWSGAPSGMISCSSLSCAAADTVGAADTVDAAGHCGCCLLPPAGAAGCWTSNSRTNFQANRTTPG